VPLGISDGIVTSTRPVAVGAVVVAHTLAVQSEWESLEHEAFESLERPVDLAAAVAGSVVTAAPLALGVALDDRVLGLFCALGAFNTALAVSSGPALERVSWGAVALGGGFVAVGLATATHDLAWLAVLATLAWSSAWALLRALGPGGTLVGFVVSAVFVIVGGQAGGPGGPWSRMLAYLTGGLLGMIAMVLAARLGRDKAAPPAPSRPHQALRAASPGGVVWHHALRIGSVTGVATALYRALSLPFGYWVPLTTLAVLQPDSHASRVRALQRAAGTLVGTALVAAVSALTSDVGVLVALVFLASGGLFALQARGYQWMVVLLTPTALLMISTVRFRGWDIAADRLVDTGIGIGLALAALTVVDRIQSRRR
jgi:Fusaric acid resistance protein-like